MKPKTGYTGTLLYQKSTVLLSQILLLFLFVSPFVTKAQFYKPSEKTIRLGAPLPEAFYQTIHQAVYAKTGQPTTICLADYHNKLIILDFWATWCKPCIGSLNRLDTLRMSMDTTGFVVIPVTYQTAKEASPAFNRFTWDMTSVVGDTLLGKIFPHAAIPHQVWIKDGKVLATPRLEYVTADNIIKAVSGQNLALRMIPKLTDRSAPLFVNGNGGDGTSVVFQTTIATGNNEYSVQSLQFSKGSDKNILMSVNVPPAYLLYEAYRQHIPATLTATNGSGMFMELNGNLRDYIVGKRPQRSAFNSIDAYQKATDDYMKEVCLSYCLVLPTGVEDGEARTIMGHDINQYLLRRYGVEGRIEKRPKVYLILEKLAGGKYSRLKSLGGTTVVDLLQKDHYILVNAPFSVFDSSPVLSYIMPQAIFEDRTGLGATDLKIDFHFPKNLKGNMERANLILKNYGLHLRSEVRATNVLVIAGGKQTHP